MIDGVTTEAEARVLIQLGLANEGTLMIWLIVYTTVYFAFILYVERKNSLRKSLEYVCIFGAMSLYAITAYCFGRNGWNEYTKQHMITGSCFILALLAIRIVNVCIDKREALR